MVGPPSRVQPIRSPMPFRFDLRNMNLQGSKLFRSIHYLPPLILHRDAVGGWSLSQLSLEREGPWIPTRYQTPMLWGHFGNHPPKPHNKQRIHYQFPSARYQRTRSEVLCLSWQKSCNKKQVLRHRNLKKQCRNGMSTPIAITERDPRVWIILNPGEKRLIK